MDPLHWQFIVRCGRKRKYRKPKLADAAAQQASLTTGELIISYQCYECRQWHIGHADRSQILARTSPGCPICEICSNPIPLERLDKGQRLGKPITTCSKRCQRWFDAQSTHPPMPVPKGPPKQAS
jgi:hypothetical protein